MNSFTADYVAAAVYWNRNSVDRENITHKLPVHARTHTETFDQNQQIRAMHQTTVDIRNRLSRINVITYQSVQ